MKKIMLGLLLSFVSSLLVAQNRFLINLEGQKFDSPLAQYSFEGLILAQEEDSCLGVLIPAYNRIPTPVYFEKGFKRELSDFLASSMPAGQGRDPLILKINRIYLYDTRTFEYRYACLDLSITFITLNDTVLFEDFTANSAVSERVSYEETTVLSLIRKAFSQCLSQYSERIQKKLTYPCRVDLIKSSESVLNNPGRNWCFASNARKKGIYRTFYDFRDNLADTTCQFTFHYDNNPDNPELTRANLKFIGELRPKKIWGFSDGTADFIKVGNSFYRLSRDSNIFYTYTHSKAYSEDIAVSAVFGGVFFGVVGAALFGGITAAATDNKYVVKTKVDMFYGKLVPYESRDYTKIYSSSVFYYSKLSIPGDMSIYFDDKLLCILTPDSYFKADFSSLHDEATIKLVFAGGAVFYETIPLKLTKTSVFLVKLKGNEKLLFNKLHDQVKNDILSKMTKANTKCNVDIR